MATDDFQPTLTCGSITVEVESFRPQILMGSCRGFAKVKFSTPVGSISIDNFRLIENAKGDYFVSPPSHKKGEKYYDDIEVTGDLKKLLNSAVKHAYSANSH